MLGDYLPQKISADDIVQMQFFLGALRVNANEQRQNEDQWGVQENSYNVYIPQLYQGEGVKRLMFIFPTSTKGRGFKRSEICYLL